MTAVAGALVVCAGLLVNPVSAVSAPPPNPTNTQLSNAQKVKDALATQVGTLSGQIAALQTRLAQLDHNAELAEQKLALALQRLQQSKDAADAARKQVRDAADAVTTAQSNFAQFVRDTYMKGSVDGLGGGLLTATDPTALLQRGEYIHFTATHQLDVIGNLNRANVARSNADAAARLAVQKQATATDNAEQAKHAADNALQAAKRLKVQLNAQLATNQSKLASAKSQLATLNNQRKQYVAWQKEQARIAAEKAAAAARAAAAAKAAAEARARAQANNSSAGSGEGASVPIAATSGGRWTAAAGQTAVNRAMKYLGWPYSFAAGNSSGPTYGIAVDFDSRNDGGVYGFDCSGLTIYAWAPYLGMDHYAATQYTQVGSFHPSVDQLMPGDLVFWSGDGTIAGIGHVALYIGGGNVIQAPFSGSVIQITPLGEVESGYYGATRPLT